MTWNCTIVKEFCIFRDVTLRGVVVRRTGAVNKKKAGASAISVGHRSHTSSDAGNNVAVVSSGGHATFHLAHNASVVGVGGGIICPESTANEMAHPHRPGGNSLLHLVGSWLFEAAVAGVKLETPSKSNKGNGCPFVALCVLLILELVHSVVWYCSVPW